MIVEHKRFGKIFRLNRPVVVTEKIDGTNCAVVVVPVDALESLAAAGRGAAVVEVEKEDGSSHSCAVYAQSRNRILFPGADHHGFMEFVHDNADGLANLLGVGCHFGEWWGKGINREYAQQGRRFALFNIERWRGIETCTKIPIETVTVLAEMDAFDTAKIARVMHDLRTNGSKHVPAWPTPEGVVVRHSASGALFKVMCEDDETAKSAVAVDA